MNTFKVENDSSDMTQDDPLPLIADSVKLEIDETENVPDLQNVMTVKAEIDESEIGKLFLYLPNSTKPYPKLHWNQTGFQIGADMLSRPIKMMVNVQTIRHQTWTISLAQIYF